MSFAGDHAPHCWSFVREVYSRGDARGQGQAQQCLSGHVLSPSTAQGQPDHTKTSCNTNCWQPKHRAQHWRTPWGPQLHLHILKESLEGWSQTCCHLVPAGGLKGCTRSRHTSLQGLGALPLPPAANSFARCFLLSQQWKFLVFTKVQAKASIQQLLKGGGGFGSCRELHTTSDTPKS